MMAAVQKSRGVRTGEMGCTVWKSTNRTHLVDHEICGYQEDRVLKNQA